MAKVRRKVSGKTKHEMAVLLLQGGKSEYSHVPAVEDINDAQRVAIIDGRVPLDTILLHQGFKWLDHWEIIAPFRPYGELAMDLVEGKTKKQVELLGLGDLRVPVFDPRLVFMRTNPRTEKVWKSYNALKEEGWNPRVAFLAAIWEHKPYVKPLPAKRWLK